MNPERLCRSGVFCGVSYKVEALQASEDGQPEGSDKI